jgi:hypothetical protein
MVRFLRRLFSPGRRTSETPRAEASVEYNGYTVTPTPQKEPGGWRLAGTISKGTGGDRKVHELVRADTSPDREAIVAMTIAKAKRIIDEQADRLFPDG